MKHKNNPTALACASFLGSAVMSQAALTVGDIISVSYGSPTYDPKPTITGAAVIGASGDTWNNLSAAAGVNVGTLGAVALVDTTNTASGVSLSITTGYFNGSTYDNSNLDLFEGGIYLDGNGVFGPAGPATITLTGLGAGTVVDLYLYGATGHASGQGATFNFGISQSVSDVNGIETSYILNENYAAYLGLVADGSGTITGTWDRNSGAGQRFSSLAGLQLTVVPEPSAALLGGLGMLCLLRRRR